MNIAPCRAYLNGLSLFIILGFIVFTGCEDPGLVGNSFTDTNTEVVIDTFEVEQIEMESLDPYSGATDFMSVGEFDDPLFGTIRVLGLMRPTIAPTDTIEDGATMKLRLRLDFDFEYGITDQQAEFELLESGNTWRSNEWKISDQVQTVRGGELSDQTGTIGSFTVEESDSIDVPLSDEFTTAFREFYNSQEADIDSTYRIEFGGLAIVPSNTGRIVPIDVSRSSFIIENPEDTTEISIEDWTHSVERSNEPASGNDNFKVFSTQEQVLKLDMDLTEEKFETINISQVELVLYQNGDELSSSISQAAPSARRPPVTQARLHLEEPEDLPIALDPGIPVSTGNLSPEGSYRINITSFVNGVLIDGVTPERTFYVTLNTIDGVIRSSLIYNNQAADEFKPKLIVTSVRTDN